MGQKTNPILLRLGIIRDSDSTWYAGKDYAEYVFEDHMIRGYLKQELDRAGVSNIKIRRKSGSIDIEVHVGRPGVVFGKNGIDTGVFVKELRKRTGKEVMLNVVEQKNSQINAKLISEMVVAQLEKRTPFRRAMKMAVQMALKSGAEGIRIGCAGRLGGVEIARKEWYREGKVPLQTLRADVDYAFSEALTTYGKIGVKVWVYNGEVLDRKPQEIERPKKNKENKVQEAVV